MAMDRFVVNKTKQFPVAAEQVEEPSAKRGQKRPAGSAFPCSKAERDYRSNRDDASEEAELRKPRSTLYKSLDLAFPGVGTSSLQWRKIERENLDLDYTLLFPRDVADALVRVFEEELDYFTGDLAKIQIFGRWHNIPRKQATYGDPGLTYTYSGIKTPARPWPPALEAVRNLVCKVTQHKYNFVLVNRYKDGNDKMGEHKDDERELDPKTPIASVSLGQPRDFYFRHQDARPPKKLNINKVQLQLQHGSLLLMNPPTNRYWYHALPPRKSAPGIRINLTFRKII